MVNIFLLDLCQAIQGFIKNQYFISKNYLVKSIFLMYFINI